MHSSFLFWLSIGIIFYTYAGYGLLLGLLQIIKGNKKKIEFANSERPTVTMVVAAYNEAICVDAKIKNSFHLVYPKDKIHFLFITDGSTDETPSIIAKYPQIKLLHQPDRKGKTAALNRAMEHVQTEIVVFSDANTLLNEDCIEQMVKHYADERVGGVAGEKKIDYQTQTTSVGIGEGLYWQYESSMKQLDAKFNTVVGAAGELFSMRTKLFRSLDDHILLDDFVQSIKICLQHYKVAYEPLAFAIEKPSSSLQEEYKRKVRIAAGDFQVLFGFPQLFNFFKHPLLSFQYFSRRVMRWLICPLALLLLFFSNYFLMPSHPVWQLFFGLQCGFYAFALIGWLLNKKGIRMIIFFLPYYFVFMNICLGIGFLRFISGGQKTNWEKAERL
jgi:poly-beta-1,6-N-acetyl-D-glucosamine synthase